MEVLLPPDLQQFIIDQVANGAFPSANVAVCRAVETLREQELERSQRRAELFREIDLGVGELERGEGSEVPAENLGEFFASIKRRGRERLTQTRESES